MSDASVKPLEKLILAFVGMPGAGKSEATKYLDQKGIPFIRFGNFTDKALSDANMELNTENERMMREKLRGELGMGAYAILAKPIIDEMLKEHDKIALDGLYSWEEYTYLKQFFPFLKLVAIYARPQLRYERLSRRAVRPVALDKAYLRDVNEIEKLNKGGPIAMADYTIENDNEDITTLHEKIDALIQKLGINL